MQILLDNDMRACAYAPDDMEWYYPEDENYGTVNVPDDAEVIQGLHDMIDYRWDGEKFRYDPKVYDE